MARIHRLLTTGAVIVCLVGTQGSGTLFASEDAISSREASASPPLTSRTSETQMSTPGGLAPALSISEHPAEMDVSSVPFPQMERSRLTLGAVQTTPSLGPIAQSALRPFKFLPTESGAFAGQVYRGRPYRMTHDGSITAIMVGAAAAITGAAILVYANRPECETRPFAGGCGYGPKVVGGAVLSGGLVGLFVGALTWK